MYLSLASRTTARTQHLSGILAATGIVNLFNPSILKLQERCWIAFRGLRSETEKPFSAFVLCVDEGINAAPKIHDMTTAFAPHIGHPVADPKLFCFDGAPWVTFNTGHFEKPNNIYVAPLNPKIGHPQRIDLPGRQSIEKNWGFFEDKGQLCALYSLDPLVILVEQSRTAEAITMRPKVGSVPYIDKKRPTLTIGTQPVLISGQDGPLALIAHRRHYFRRKRLYTGRPVLVEPTTGQVGIGAQPWFHNLRALRGERLRHNSNLLSCTYFSGLSQDGSNMIVSYGINDLDFALAEISQNAWTDLLHKRYEKGQPDDRG